MYRLNFHSYPSHYSIPFEYHYKNTVNCRLNILQGNGTLFGILTQRFFNHYRSNKLYICAKRYLFNKLILTPPPVLCQSFSQFYINGNPKMTKNFLLPVILIFRPAGGSFLCVTYYTLYKVLSASQHPSQHPVLPHFFHPGSDD